MKKKVIITLLCSMLLAAGCGKQSDPVEIESETVAPVSSLVVTKESDEIDFVMEEEEETEESGILTGSGTGDTAEIETEYDMAYENQLAEEESTETSVAATIMYATGAVNIRDEASTTAAIVGKYQKNDMVFVYTIEDDWAKVNYNDAERYVNKNYLSATKVEESTSQATTVKDDSAAQAQSKSQSENRISEEAAKNGTQTGTSENVPPAEDTTGRIEPEETTPPAEAAPPAEDLVGSAAPEENTPPVTMPPCLAGNRVLYHEVFSDDYVPIHDDGIDLSGGYHGDPKVIEGVVYH